MDFAPFPKIARLSRDIVITEKLDGMNASVYIEAVDPPIDESRIDIAQGWLYVRSDGAQFRMRVGSRTRWITPQDDNHGFARWAYANARDLVRLGAGHHFGEWWGLGIQRGYGLPEKRFSLFNVGRWYAPADCDAEDLTGRAPAPSCCRVVPVLARGPMNTDAVDACLHLLSRGGSYAAPGFMKPEGVVIWHEAARVLFKKTIEKDEAPKSAGGAQC